MCEGWRLASGVFFKAPHLIFLRQSFSLNPDLVGSAILAGNQTSETLLSLLPLNWQDRWMLPCLVNILGVKVSGDLNSGLRTAQPPRY